MSLNRWAYVQGNPLIYTDPSGQFAQIIAAASLGTVMGLAAGAVIGRITYEAAIAGECGCDMWQSAVAAGSQSNWTKEMATYGALVGMVGAAIASSGPIGMSYVGMFGLTASSMDFLRTTYSIYAEGLTYCKIGRLFLDVMGMAVSAAAIQKGFTEIYAPETTPQNTPSGQNQIELLEAQRKSLKRL